MPEFDVDAVRAQFPALSRELEGVPVAYLDGPGGTQVHETVIEAVSGYLQRGGANLGGPFVTSVETDGLTAEARRAVADLVNAAPEEIVFGQNMTSLTFAISRALARTWEAGDEIVVTRLDHDANISPWLLAAADVGVTVRWADFEPEACRLDYDGLAGLLGPRTRLVAVTAASNAVGTQVDVARVGRLAHAVGAVLYVDGVHNTPHRLVDVAAWDCDFYAASAYKFFGPHIGFVYGKSEHLEALRAYKVRPAPDSGPDKWETGTQSFESLAGVTAAVDYLAGLGSGRSRRDRIVSAMEAVTSYETGLSERFLAGVAEVPGASVYGLTSGAGGRTPTFALSVDGVHADEVASRLGEQGIFVWSGHYYAVAVMERLGVLDSGGLVRVGFVHYNTAAEVDRVLAALEGLAG